MFEAMLLNYILMTGLDKNDPIWYPKSIPNPTDTQGLAKAAQIPNKAVQSQRSIEAETAGTKGKKNRLTLPQ